MMQQPTPCPLVPIGERVILSRIDSSTQRGLRIPQTDMAAEDVAANVYEVVALPDVKSARHNIGATCLYSLRVGDRVYLARHKGWKIETSDGQEFYAAEAADILAVDVDPRDAEEASV